MSDKKDSAAKGPMGGPRMQATEKPKNFKWAVGKLLSILEPHKYVILFTVILLIVTEVFMILSPKILGNMTNQIVDDLVGTKIYDSVQEFLPEGVEIPDGTTIETLPKFIENLAKSGVLSAQQVEQLQQMQEQNNNTNLENISSSVMSLDLSKEPVFHYDQLANTALILIGLFIIGSLANYWGGWIFSGAIQKAVFKLRRDISKKINRMPISYFDKHAYGDTLSRITNDVDTIGQSINQVAGNMLGNIIMLIGTLIMMLVISPLMTLIAVVVLPINFIIIGVITKKSQKHFKNQQNQLGEINGHIEEIYAGQVIVKAFSGEAKAEEKFNKINERLYKSAWKSQFLSGLSFVSMNVMSNVGYVVTVLAGGYLAINGQIPIGDVQAFIQYVSQMGQPVVQMAQAIGVLQSAVAAAERVFEFLEEKEEAPDSLEAKVLNNVRGEVEFKNVKFSYDNELVIHDFSAKIKPGQKVAIVGPTGAGKTTIVNLLMRFYDPKSGSITIDGVNTLDMKRSDVRRKFGMVLQDTWLFNGTIADNIKYGDLKANNNKAVKAAKAAHVDHFVQSLPNGYETMVDEDAESVSAGEKQLLTIARAMLADAPMMILDEATSSVDTRTEILIQQAMEKLTAGRTSFIIAHRLSTIRNADLILVMNNGNIIEQGTHETLLKKGGFYAGLYNAQFVEE